MLRSVLVLSDSAVSSTMWLSVMFQSILARYLVALEVSLLSCGVVNGLMVGPLVLVKSPAGHWRPIPVAPGARTEDGLVIYRFGTSLYFANVPKLVDDVMTLTRHGGPVRWLLIDCTAIEDIDYTASVALARLASLLLEAADISIEERDNDQR